MSGYFIAGTDTGVGKTRVTCGLLSALRSLGVQAAGMKPVAAGSCEDVDQILHVTGQAEQIGPVCPYLLPEPLSPHLAAAHAGVSLQIDAICRAFNAIHARYPLVLVEGAGGWHAPISDGQTMADVAVAMRLPVILVVGLRLGCLNHALLTAEAIRAAGLPLAGWVANRIDPAMLAVEENIATLRARLHAAPLAELPFDRPALAPAAPFLAAAPMLADGIRIRS